MELLFATNHSLQRDEVQAAVHEAEEQLSQRKVLLATLQEERTHRQAELDAKEACIVTLQQTVKRFQRRDAGQKT